MGGLQVKGTIDGENGDFDTITGQGVYNIRWGTKAANNPGIDWGLLIVFKGIYITQLAIGISMKTRYSDVFPIKFSEWSI